MDQLFPFIVPQKLEDASLNDLRTAISRKSYRSINRELRRHTGIFSPRDAYFLFCFALNNRLRCEALEAILNHCPPVPEILSASGDTHCLVGRAAELKRADVITMLLEHGASPNRTPGCDISPLEAALRSDSLNCVKLLLEQPDLDTAWTPELLVEWALPNDISPFHGLCIRAMASRFTGWDPRSGQPMPIPEPMTAETIVNAQNLSLLERFCRERGSITLKDGLCVAGYFDPGRLDCFCRMNNSDLISLVTTLFKYCPHLLRKEKACQALLRCFLRLDGEARARLRPWVERLGRRWIAMERNDWLHRSFGGYTGFLEQWQTLLPQGPTLAIERWSDVFERWTDGFDRFIREEKGWESLNAETLSRILSACPIRGGGRKGKLSPLAQAVLHRGDAPMIESLLEQPRGLLAAEDPDALTAYVLESDCPYANRAAALAHVRKEVSYDL